MLNLTEGIFSTVDCHNNDMLNLTEGIFSTVDCHNNVMLNLTEGIFSTVDCHSNVMLNLNKGIFSTVLKYRYTRSSERNTSSSPIQGMNVMRLLRETQAHHQFSE